MWSLGLVSVTITHLCHCRGETVIDNMQDNMKSLALLQYTFFFFFLTKIGGWLDKLVDLSLTTPEYTAEECNKKSLFILGDLF